MIEKQVFIHFSSEAQPIFNDWLAKLNQKIKTEENTGKRSHLAKYKGALPKIAALLQIVDLISIGPLSGNHTIDVAHLNKAIDLMACSRATAGAPVEPTTSSNKPTTGQLSALSGVAGPRSLTQFVIRSAAYQSREIRTPMIDDPHGCIWQSVISELDPAVPPGHTGLKEHKSDINSGCVQWVCLKILNPYLLSTIPASAAEEKSSPIA
jgi:hypothetical protein